MTVAELIACLKQCPQDVAVVVQVDDYEEPGTVFDEVRTVATVSLIAGGFRSEHDYAEVTPRRAHVPKVQAVRLR